LKYHLTLRNTPGFARARGSRCPRVRRAWEWSYVDRIRPTTSSHALRFGSLIHGALETFYKPGGLKRGPRPAITFEKLYKEELKRLSVMGWRDDEGTWHNALDLGTSMLEGYYNFYGKDSRWYVLGCELPFHVPVYHPISKRLLFTYVGVMDLVVRDRGLPGNPTGIVDHKTTRDDPTKKADILVLDEQTGTYWSHGRDWLYANGYVKKNVPLAGMIHNFLRKGMSEEDDDRAKNAQGQFLNKPKKEVLVEAYKKKFKRDPGRGENNVEFLTYALGEEAAAQLGEVSKKQAAPHFHRELTYRDEYDSSMVKQRILQQYRLMRSFRDGELPVFKTPGTLHNPHCRWCDYRDMCELHEQGANWEELRDATMASWEPYSQHEIEDGEKR
jgi:hypothetical protein